MGRAYMKSRRTINPYSALPRLFTWPTFRPTFYLNLFMSGRYRSLTDYCCRINEWNSQLLVKLTPFVRSSFHVASMSGKQRWGIWDIYLFLSVEKRCSWRLHYRRAIISGSFRSERPRETPGSFLCRDWYTGSIDISHSASELCFISSHSVVISKQVELTLELDWDLLLLRCSNSIFIFQPSQYIHRARRVTNPRGRVVGLFVSCLFVQICSQNLAIFSSSWPWLRWGLSPTVLYLKEISFFCRPRLYMNLG